MGAFIMGVPFYIDGRPSIEVVSEFFHHNVMPFLLSCESTIEKMCLLFIVYFLKDVLR